MSDTIRWEKERHGPCPQGISVLVEETKRNYNSRLSVPFLAAPSVRRKQILLPQTNTTSDWTEDSLSFRYWFIQPTGSHNLLFLKGKWKVGSGPLGFFLTSWRRGHREKPACWVQSLTVPNPEPVLHHHLFSSEGHRPLWTHHYHPHSRATEVNDT